MSALWDHQVSHWKLYWYVFSRPHFHRTTSSVPFAWLQRWQISSSEDTEGSCIKRRLWSIMLHCPKLRHSNRVTISFFFFFCHSYADAWNPGWPGTGDGALFSSNGECRHCAVEKRASEFRRRHREFNGLSQGNPKTEYKCSIWYQGVLFNHFVVHYSLPFHHEITHPSGWQTFMQSSVPLSVNKPNLPKGSLSIFSIYPPHPQVPLDSFIFQTLYPH